MSMTQQEIPSDTVTAQHQALQVLNLAQRTATIEQASHGAQQVPEQVARPAHGDDVEHDLVEVDLKP